MHPAQADYAAGVPRRTVHPLEHVPCLMLFALMQIIDALCLSEGASHTTVQASSHSMAREVMNPAVAGCTLWLTDSSMASMAYSAHGSKQPCRGMPGILQLAQLGEAEVVRQEQQ